MKKGEKEKVKERKKIAPEKKGNGKNEKSGGG